MIGVCYDCGSPALASFTGVSLLCPDCARKRRVDSRPQPVCDHKYMPFHFGER